MARDAPRRLSESASTAVFDVALGAETADGRRGPLAQLVSKPGYRRQLRRRIHNWTISERSRDGGGDSVDAQESDAVEAAERAVFHRYRSLLKDLDAEDESGLSIWASLRLSNRPTASSGRAGDPLVFLDFGGDTPAQWRILHDALGRPRSVDVTLCHQDDSARTELFLTTTPIRERLLELGLNESILHPDGQRPSGLQEVDQRLFHGTSPRIELGEGLWIQGGPIGMDMGRMVVHRVKELVDHGTDPDEILLAFPRWDDQSEVVGEVMQRAGLRIHDAAPKALAVDPAVAVALQAASIPVEDWETDLVVRFLRNGRLRPDWMLDDGARVDHLMLAEAASTLREHSVFRGSDQILTTLARELAIDTDVPDPIDRARRERKFQRTNQAYSILKKLVDTLAPLNQAKPWGEHAEQFRKAVELLNIAGRDGRALAELWDALEERADVYDRLGKGRTALPWSEFVEELTDVVTEITAPVPTPCPGSIRMVLVDDLPGCRADHIVIAGLIEGSYPRRPAVRRFLDLKPGEAPGAAARSVYSAEELRFLRAIGAAGRGVHLFYPTTDAKGQPLLRSGFLDELLNALSPDVEAAHHRAYTRFHPALLDADELAVLPADARVLAVALAVEHGRTSSLRKLAQLPGHRSALRGTAAAITALERRRKGNPFSAFEGRIGNADVRARLTQEFSAVTHTFSPSQLESYLACPFQFFSRHVLHLNPLTEQDELDEDFTERGSRLHDILEEFEKRRAESDGAISDKQLLTMAVDKILVQEVHTRSELDLGLREIEYGQIERIVAQYTLQRSEYADLTADAPAPTWFEFGFGEAGTPHPLFELALGEEVVKLKGRIDRIDVVPTPAGPRFRIIDYKSGSPPPAKDVTEGRMLQLPLYAMAVETLLYANGETAMMDVGYWGLKDKGYKPIVFERWQEVREELTRRVLKIIERIRDGGFEVAPRKEGCETYCEYRSVCRIRQVRTALKTLPIDEQGEASAEKTLGGRPAKRPRSGRPKVEPS